MSLTIRTSTLHLAAAILSTMAIAPALPAQGTLADYQRAQGLQAKARSLVVNTPGPINWIGDSDRFWYSRPVKGGTEFMLVDAAAGVKKPAFDHDRLAAAISVAASHPYTGLALPFAPSPNGRGGDGGGRGAAGGPPMTAPLTFLDGERSIQFGVGGFLYMCTVTDLDYNCTKGGAIPVNAGGRGARGGAPEDDSAVNPEGPGGDPVDGLEYQERPPQQDDAGGVNRNRERSGCAPQPQNRAQAQGRGGRGGAPATIPGQTAPDVCASFDGKWEALIQNFNVFLKKVDSNEPALPLSTDGSEGNYYTLRSIAWSPDSKKLAAYHTRPGYDRQVHYIESSPVDQLQPKHTSMS